MSTVSKVGLGIGAALALGVGGYFAFGAMFGPKADLTSGDTGRVVGALAKMDAEAFAAEDNADLRRSAVNTLKNASLADVFDRMRSADLTEEERARLRENMGQVMRESMAQNVDEYEAATSEEEKTAVIDRHLDEWIEFQEEMRAYHEAHKDDPEYQKEMAQAGQRQGGNWTPPSRDERKQRMESRNPDETVRFFRYFGQMMQRANERGVNMFGGPGGPGGRRGR